MSASTVERQDTAINLASEYKKWDSAVKDLAADLHKPEAQVRDIFQAELQQLRNAAKVKTFISIFALRRVKESLKSNGTLR